MWPLFIVAGFMAFGVPGLIAVLGALALYLGIPQDVYRRHQEERRHRR